MPVPTAYIHALRGRLRVKIWEVKGCPAKALEIEALLRKCDGVYRATANPITGNVLIHYDADLIGQAQIIWALQDCGYLQVSGTGRGPAQIPFAPVEELATALLQSLARSAMELAVQRLVMALI